MLNVLVCLKLVPDPEGPPTSYEVDSEGKKMICRGISPVANPFDENALEAAIRLKEAVGAKITLLSMGKSISKAVMLKALASGADESIILEGERFDGAILDSGQTVALLAAAIRDAGNYDLILTGRQASDTNAGVVGFGIASALGLPVISLAQKITYEKDRFVVERVLPNGYEVLECGTGLLITVSGELGELRYPSMAAIKGAKKLPQTSLKYEDLKLDELSDSVVQTIEMVHPVRERKCTMVECDCSQDAGKKLADILFEAKVL